MTSRDKSGNRWRAALYPKKSSIFRGPLLAVLIVSVAMAVTGCGGGGTSSPQGTSGVIISIKTGDASSKTGMGNMASTSTAVTSIRYTVSGSGMSTMSGTIPVMSNATTISLNVPNGPARDFLIEALDSGGAALYNGAATADLNGTAVNLSITLTAVQSNPGQAASATETLYSVNKDGTISLFDINSTTGALSYVQNVTTTAGSSPLEIDPSGKFAYMADYGHSRIDVYDINGTTGALVNGPSVSDSLYPFGVVFDSAHDFAYVNNSMGDMVYTIDGTTGALVNGISLGAGISEVAAVAPNANIAYVWDINSSGALADHINTATGALTNGVPVSAENMAITPSGYYGYAVFSNDVAAYSINQSTGALTSDGTAPLANAVSSPGIALDPPGRFLYAEYPASGATGYIYYVQAYTIQSGALVASGSPVKLTGATGLNGAIDPSGKFAYVQGGSFIYVYGVDQTTGALKATNLSYYNPAGFYNITAKGQNAVW